MKPGKTLQATIEAMKLVTKWANEGKTFIYLHPKFVAIDRKTYEELIANKYLTTQIYDEFSRMDETTLEVVRHINSGEKL